MIRVDVFNAHKKYRILRQATKNLAEFVLMKERYRDAEINIVMVNDKKMQQLNGKYLDHWYATDVLSFPLGDSTALKVEGEVYINLDQARRQAKEYGVSYRNETARLVIHGVLHLLGYDDATKAQKQTMTKLEDRYLRHLR